MTAHLLSHTQIIILQEDIAEVIINEGVEINLEMLAEIHEILINHLKSPFSLLINKLNHYALSFEAQQQMSRLTQVNARAVVVYDKASEASSRLIAHTSRQKPQNFQIFYDRHSALEWLQAMQRNSRASV